MAYYFLATVFFLSLFFLSVLLLSQIFQPRYWQRYKRRLRPIAVIWFIAYAIFILFFTGPDDITVYPAPASSPYKLPWRAGVGRFVAQGNRSFTSHRDFHRYAWDFVMPVGTEVLAARDGEVVEVDDSREGIGFLANFVTLGHRDGQRSVYAHIRKQGALVKVGDQVLQGQPIALSGMVGQTLFPHLHFYVISPDGSSSMPITFEDVLGGIPLAGRFYTSENALREK